MDLTKISKPTLIVLYLASLALTVLGVVEVINSKNSTLLVHESDTVPPNDFAFYGLERGRDLDYRVIWVAPTKFKPT